MFPPFYQAMWLPSEKASLSLTWKLFFPPRMDGLFTNPPLLSTLCMKPSFKVFSCSCFTVRNNIALWYEVGWSAVLSCLSHVRLCDTMDCSPPDSSVRGILQARILEWVAMLSSRGSSKNPCVLCLLHCKLILSPWATGVLLSYWGNPRVGMTQD